MKTKHLNTGLALITASLTLVLFNNFSFISWTLPAPADAVHEAARVSHARELLGTAYLGSDAQKIEGSLSLHMALEGKVRNALAPKWKSHAAAITRTVIQESAKYELDPVFVLAVIKTESKFNPMVMGRYGEIGLMQIKPSTAQWMAEKIGLEWKGPSSLKDPATNIQLSLAYMNYLRTKFPQTPTRYVAAYNMGPLNVKRLVAKKVTPAEYNSRVMKNYREIYAKIADKKVQRVAINQL